MSEKFPNTEFILVRIFPYLVQIRENMDQKETPYLDTLCTVYLMTFNESLVNFVVYRNRNLIIVSMVSKKFFSSETVVPRCSIKKVFLKIKKTYFLEHLWMTDPASLKNWSSRGTKSANANIYYRSFSWILEIIPVFFKTHTQRTRASSHIFNFILQHWWGV